MNVHLERGSSSLAFVLLLFAMGMLTLNGLQRQLNQQREAVASEVGFLKQYAGAVSALSWGAQQSWKTLNQWQCQQQGNEWKACLLITSKGEGVMAAQGIFAQDKTPITLWRWGRVENARWDETPHGWLDFCPLSEPEQCRLPE